MKNRHAEIRETFLRVSEVEDAGTRQKLLEAACGADSELRREVEEMIRAETDAAGFFGGVETAPFLQAALQDSDAKPQVAHEEIGSVIGRYRLVDKIGEGGFGVVYMAEQTEPVRRRVALKIIKLGMDTREVIARFDAERQALALMDHANVARVLDAGATSSGRPFFVMELVTGLPITDFCDQHRLTAMERLELLARVCRAVQHAHSKGVIHRDLKPSNILVAEVDGRPEPKIIDFGIAKAIQQPLTDHALLTRSGQIIGTPVYMSPEHVAGTDVDTRSDVYSLGVILYELLTGKPPFDAERLRGVGYVGMVRMIQEDDPPPPSTRLTQMGGSLGGVAQSRSVTPRRLGEIVRGDLDWVTMKALHKDRARRYETPLALAEDLGRYLRRLPVTAGPASATYRTLKFVQRHRYSVAAMAGVAVSMVAGLILATAGFLQARREEQRARIAETVAESQRRIAVLETERARQNESHAQQISYASDMALASHSLAASNPGRALELLRRHSAGPSRDLRGWEWRYLWSQCQSAELLQLGQLPNSALSGDVSRDGTLALGADLDGTLAVWDVHSRKSLLMLTNMQSSAAFTPSGDSVVLGDGSLIEIQSGRITGHLPGTSASKRLTFSADGRYLAALNGSEVLVWDFPSMNLLGRHEGFSCPSMHVGGLAWAPNSAWLAIGLENGQIKVIDPRTGVISRSWQGHEDRITALQVSRDGKRLVSAAGFTEHVIKLWDLTSGRLEAALDGHHAWISSLAFSPDGSLLASASADQTVALWNMSSHQLASVLRGHLHEVWNVSFFPDNKTLLTTGKEGSLKLWRVPVPAAADHTPSEPPEVVSFTPDYRELLGLAQDGSIGRWTSPSLHRIGTLDAMGSNNVRLASSPELGLIASVEESGNVRIGDFVNRYVRSDLTVSLLGGKASWIGFASKRKRLVVVLEAGKVRLFDLDSSKLSVVDCTVTDARSIGVNCDGQFLATGGPALKVYDLAKGGSPLVIKAHRFFVDAVAFSPDGKSLATGSMDGLAKLWSTETWQCSGVLTGHLLGVHSIAFSGDGKRIATGSLGDEAIKLWDLKTLQEVLNLPSPGDITWALAFSPDGRHLVSYGSRHGTRCWSAPSLEEIENTESSKAFPTVSSASD
jgi:WD40 repeat protein/serine/threonine protein kinase